MATCMYHPHVDAYKGGYCMGCVMGFEAGARADAWDEGGGRSTPGWPVTSLALSAPSEVDPIPINGADNYEPRFTSCMYHPEQQALNSGLCLVCMTAMDAGSREDSATTNIDPILNNGTDNYEPRFTSCMYHPEQQALNSGLCLVCMTAMDAGSREDSASTNNSMEFSEGPLFAENTEQLSMDCPYLEQLTSIEFATIAQQLSAHEMTTLGSILNNLEMLAAFAIGVAEVEKDGHTRQKVGTEAHNWFEALNRDLPKPADRVGSSPEYFSIKGVQQARHSKGSKSVDLMIMVRGEPLLGVDLKVGRPWNSRERQRVIDEVGANVIQIGPFVPGPRRTPER